MTAHHAPAIDSDSRRLYLDILKKTLAYYFWPEPLAPIDMDSSARPLWKKLPIWIASRMLRPFGICLAYPRIRSRADRESGTGWPAMAHTMIGIRRLENIQHCVETAITDGVPGDLIETGVWRGGACIFMRGILAAWNVNDRQVFVADSFRGLPPPDPIRYPNDLGDDHFKHSYLSISRRDVEDHFRQFGLLDEHVCFLEGWFKDTLCDPKIQTLAVIRLDGDMYSSTIESLSALYPRLSPGGFCIIDDYALPGCRQAVHDYRKQMGIQEEIIDIDGTGAYWRKTRS